MIQVVAGIIWREDKVLIAKRGLHKSLAGKWEFPGGKIEQGESPEAALERELKEELGITTQTLHYFVTNFHQYPSMAIVLNAYYSRYVSGIISLIDHDQVEWVKPTQLGCYDFAEADLPIVNKLITLPN